MRRLLLTIALMLVGFAAGFVLRGSPLLSQSVTLRSLSPADTYRVSLVERPGFIDRNFDVRVEDLRAGSVKIMFRSPDEGTPVGSERVVWSEDGTRFLILGRHFFVAQGGTLRNGEQAYLMVDLHTGRVWCNALQQTRFRRFGVEDLEAIRWKDWAPA